MSYKLGFNTLPSPISYPAPVDSFIRIGGLRRVMFVLSMNWPRMGRGARRKWVWKLKEECERIVRDCDQYLETGI